MRLGSCSALASQLYGSKASEKASAETIRSFHIDNIPFFALRVGISRDGVFMAVSSSDSAADAFTGVFFFLLDAGLFLPLLPWDGDVGALDGSTLVVLPLRFCC
jgi:hypothetical protein